MPPFGTKGSQVQILSPRLKAAESFGETECSAAFFLVRSLFAATLSDEGAER